MHLWIGIDDGVLLVLDEDEHRLFERLQTAGSLVDAVIDGSRQIEDRWREVTALVTRCAEAGFLENVPGFHGSCRIAPEEYARLHVTARCQLECIHCYAASGPKASAAGELSAEHWRRIVDDIARAGGRSVLFTGGEPLIRPDCASLMRHAADGGLEVTLFTNGLLVGRYLGDFAGAATLVQVSLNGPDEASNDSIRGPGTFRKVMRAIALLVDSGVPVRIGMTVMEQNWAAIRDGFPAFAAQFAGANVRFHLGYGVCHYGRGSTLGDRLNLDEVRPTLERYLESANGPAGRRITRKTKNCGYCEQLVVGPDGGVYPCHLLHGRLGHIDDRSVPEWHQILRQTAERHLVDTISGCATCDLRNLCGGTCRVVNEQTTGSKWVTTCTGSDREAKYRNLVYLFHKKGGEETGKTT
jgi:radical SAM protein with 4Fe4S-binding SPASM domain